LPIADEVREIAGTFLPELAGYCELVSGPAGATSLRVLPNPL
jgi:hypothetical protein